MRVRASSAGAWVVALACLAVLSPACAPPTQAGLVGPARATLRGLLTTKDAIPIDHVVVIYLENHSFDNLYGLFPGAEGLASAVNAPSQMDDLATQHLALLPRILDSNLHSAGPAMAPDGRFPAELANRPFDIGQYVKVADRTGDLVHRFFQE